MSASPTEPHASRPRPRMDAWRRRFTRNLLAISTGLQLPFVLLLALAYARAMAWPLAALLALLTLAVLNVPLGRFVLRWWDESRAPAWRVWLVETPFYVHFIASLFYGPLSYLLVLGWLGARALGVPVAGLLHYLVPLYLVAALTGAYATLVRRFWVVTSRIEVAVPGLPAELDGYTLAHLSDIHCGPYLPPRFYRWLARRASTLGADAVVVTGDLIAGGASYLSDLTEFIAGLSAPDGVFVSLGNHDYYGTVEGVPDAARAGGATVLRNAGALLGVDRGGVYLAAIDDSWSRRDDLDAALAARPSGAPCVLLAHDPAKFPAIAKRGDIALTLSGHTHGGQLAAPFVHRHVNLAALRYRYTSGIYREGAATLFVHRGVGTSGPPARLGAAPEIALVALRRAPG